MRCTIKNHQPHLCIECYSKITVSDNSATTIIRTQTEIEIEIGIRIDSQEIENKTTVPLVEIGIDETSAPHLDHNVIPLNPTAVKVDVTFPAVNASVKKMEGNVSIREETMTFVARINVVRMDDALVLPRENLVLLVVSFVVGGLSVVREDNVSKKQLPRSLLFVLHHCQLGSLLPNQRGNQLLCLHRFLHRYRHLNQLRFLRFSAEELEQLALGSIKFAARVSAEKMRHARIVAFHLVQVAMEYINFVAPVFVVKMECVEG